VTWLIEHGGVDVVSLTAALEHQSGLRGLTGTSGDFRDVLAGRADGDADCVLAFDVYVHTLVREIGAMAATAGGLDLLVFTGGVGEHVPEVRAAAAERLAHLGVALDEDANAVAESDAVIGSSGAPADTVVVTAAEAAEVARLTREVLASRGG
jgi:acetate kinase